MEYLDVNSGWGQSYGYVMYRTLLPSYSQNVLVHGLRDYGVVSAHGKRISSCDKEVAVFKVVYTLLLVSFPIPVLSSFSVMCFERIGNEAGP